MDGAVAPEAGAPAIVDLPADRRVADLERLIDSGDFDLLSLDVFDTYVYREAPTPADVFFHVARRLRERGMLHASATAESLVRERIAAENRARARKPGHEVTLEEIWAEFPRGYLRSGTPDDGRAAEWECERAVVRVHEPMRALVARARARGMKTAFVSDTYFSRRQIHALTHTEPDWTIVSCEHGVSKRAGLHRVLLQRSRVAPARVLHVGDNRGADIEGPGAFGIPRYWLRRFPDGFEDLLEREMPAAFSVRAPLVGDADGGLTACRSHAMAACRTPHAQWGAGVLGPVVAGYAAWVIARCAEEDIGTVLCLMREGRALKHALEALGAPLAAHEAFVSRYVALKASIVAGSEAEIARFVLRPSPTPAARILGQLGLEPADVPDVDPSRRLAPEDSRALIARIASTPALRTRVVASSTRARESLLAHLRPMLPGLGGRVAIVDLGYKGTIQMGLQAALDRERLGVTTHGLYLVTGGEVCETQRTGARVEGWLAENGQPVSMAHTFMRSPEIFEQGLMAECGTTLGHDADGTPRLDAFHVPESQRREIAEVRAGLDAFLALWSARRAGGRGGDPPAMQALCRAIAVRAVARPLPVELEAFGSWRHDENFGSSEVRTLVEPAGLHDWERSHLSAHQLASLPHAQLYWPFGLAWRVSDSLGEAVASIFLRSAEPAAFDSATGERPLTVLWDTGSGFGESTSAPSAYRLGSHGRCWHRVVLGVDGPAPRHVAFALGQAGDVLRVTGVRLLWIPARGEPERQTLAADALAVQGAGRLGPGLYRVDADCGVIVATPDPRGEFRGTLQLDLFFAMLPEA